MAPTATRAPGLSAESLLDCARAVEPLVPEVLPEVLPEVVSPVLAVRDLPPAAPTMEAVTSSIEADPVLDGVEGTPVDVGGRDESGGLLLLGGVDGASVDGAGGGSLELGLLLNSDSVLDGVDGASVDGAELAELMLAALLKHAPLSEEDSTRIDSSHPPSPAEASKVIRILSSTFAVTLQSRKFSNTLCWKIVPRL